LSREAAHSILCAMWTIADGVLWPWPKRVVPLEGERTMRAGGVVWIGDERLAEVALGFVDELRSRGLHLRLSAARSGPLEPEASLVLDESAHLAPQGYALVVDGDGARIECRDVEGARHALATLLQWIDGALELHGAPRLPCAAVEDWPAFAERGAMLDVSRTRIPLDGTLLDCARRMAGMKTNRWQLYFEHAFAYAGHEQVWRGSSAYDGDEILRLDARLRALGVELVPNQQSFGHMHRWLVHERYRPLAEVPEGVEHAFSIHKEPFALCPSDPRALELVEDLWDQLVPHFKSRTLNIGGDETFDLGMGRSKAEVERRGVGRVYLEHVLRLHERASARGLSLQLWGDIVVQHPELVAELPRDLVLMEWGYDAGHPFADHARRFAETGIPFHVCPGTSSWQSISGRATNALANLKEAALQGERAGARGWLATDWGDRGHLQPRSASWFGFVAAAGLAWNPDSARDLDERLWARILSRRAYDDASGRSGALQLELARAHESCGATSTNGSPLFFTLAFADKEWPHPRVKDPSRSGFLATREHLLDLRGRIDLSGSRRADAPHIADEWRHACDLLATCCELGAARCEAPPGTPLAGLPAEARKHLAARLREHEAEHRRLWLCTERPGGLDESCGWISRPRALLESGA
jgi:hypothetical protein